MRELIVSPQAHADLEEIHRYVVRNNPGAAQRVLDEMQAKFRLLFDSPFIGRERPELAQGLRSFPVGNYLIFYSASPRGLEVARVIHTARNLDEVFD